MHETLTMVQYNLLHAISLFLGLCLGPIIIVVIVISVDSSCILVQLRLLLESRKFKLG